MTNHLLEARADLGWVAVPDSAPERARKSISEVRSRLLRSLNPNKRSAKSQVATPAVSTPDTVTAQEREAVHRRVQAAIIANLL